MSRGIFPGTQKVPYIFTHHKILTSSKNLAKEIAWILASLTCTRTSSDVANVFTFVAFSFECICI